MHRDLNLLCSPQGDLVIQPVASAAHFGTLTVAATVDLGCVFLLFAE